MTSAAHDLLLYQIKALGLPEPDVEYRFCERRWRWDLAWPDRMVCLDVQGSIWTQGKHTRGAGYTNDCEKANTAALLGWRVLHFTTAMVEDGIAVDVIERALRG